jgi:hypothetical protein
MKTKDLAEYLYNFIAHEIEANQGVYERADILDWLNSGIEAFESTNNVKIAIGKTNLLTTAPTLLKACKVCVKCFDKIATLNLSEMTIRVIKDNAAIVSAIIAQAESE